MSAVIGALRAELSASIAQFQSDLGKAADSVKGFSKDCEKVATGLEKIGTRMSVAITAPLLLLGSESVKAAKGVTQSLGQISSALESTGGRSGKTVGELQKLAKQLETISTFDDDDILKDVSANLLRFENISGSVFDRAQKAAVNLSARLGIDLSAAASTVGKALDQPITGLAALSRLGVRFTQDQKAQITALVEAGKGYQAQGEILKALEERFDGAALAARKASPDAAFLQQWRDLQETIGAIVVTAGKPLLDFMERLAKAFNDLTPAMQQNIVEWGAIAAATGPALIALGAVVSAIGKLAPILAQVGALIADVFASGPLAYAAGYVIGLGIAFAGLAAAVTAVVALILPFKDLIVGAISDIWNYAKDALGSSFQNLLATLGDAWAQLAATLTQLWNGPVGTFLKVLGKALATIAEAFVYAFGGIVITTIRVFVDVVSAAAIALVDSLDAVVKFLHGDFVGAWKAAKKAVTDTAAAITESNKPKPQAPAAPPKPQVETVTVTGIRQKPAFKANFDLGPGAAKAEAQLKRLEDAADKDALAVRRFALGDLPPLDKALEDVDTRFEGLRNTIEGHIDDLKKLGLQNGATKATMVLLESQLGALDAAHAKARDAAKAQYEAEKQIADLQTQAQNLRTNLNIRDLEQARGSLEVPVTETQKSLQKNADALAQEQLDAQTRIAELTAQKDKAELQGDQDSVDRLNSIIATQQQYYDLVQATTAEQLTAQETIQKAWGDFSQGVGDQLLDVLTTFQFNAKGAMGVLKSVIADLLKPVTDQAGAALGGLLKAGFSGFFADGGFIPPGQWGIAGENGAEPVFGGRKGATVIPAQDGSSPGTIYIDARGAVETVPAQIAAAIRQAAPGIVSTAVTQAGKNVPSQMVSAQKRKL